MRILVHDYSGHPFQAELSRELATRGHAVVHSHCAGDVSGKGRLAAGPDDTVEFEPIGQGRVVAKLDFARRVLQELRLAVELLALVRRRRPDVVLAANVPVPMLVVTALGLLVLRTPWVLWHQDVQSVALRSFVGGRLSSRLRWVALAFEVGERWCARRAARVVVITEAFLDVHESWGTAAKAECIPNWAPLDEIQPRPRHNDWSRRHGLDDVQTLLYAGTLGLKHDPLLLVELARAVIDQGCPLRLVVVNEGPAVDLIREEAAKLDVPTTLVPFQDYADLPDVLGTGDVLVVLLEPSAGAFSVPSKTLTYLCAARPVVALVPSDNEAARLVRKSGGCSLAPGRQSTPGAASWVADVLRDETLRSALGTSARGLAERSFCVSGVTSRFEGVLLRASS